MIARSAVNAAQDRALALFRTAGVPIRDDEKNSIAIVDFGLGHFDEEGMHLFTMVSTSRYAAKALALTPWQTEPEHWHPPVDDDPGKEETVRVLWGTLLFYIDGEDTLKRGRIPRGKESVYVSRHELAMKPGDQITLKPNQKHWFQADGGGVVIYTFSSTARDILDCFSDSAISRVTKIDENS